MVPSYAATQVWLIHLYASIGDWKWIVKSKKHMKDGGLKTTPEYNWIEVGNETHKFKAEDGLDVQVKEIIDVLDTLIDHIKVSATVQG